jgi:hypothetical protein
MSPFPFASAMSLTALFWSPRFDIVNIKFVDVLKRLIIPNPDVPNSRAITFDFRIEIKIVTNCTPPNIAVALKAER